jgi:hypothetical protein
MLVDEPLHNEAPLDLETDFEIVAVTRSSLLTMGCNTINTEVSNTVVR